MRTRQNLGFRLLEQRRRRAVVVGGITYELRDDFTDVDGTLVQSHTPTWAGGAGVGAWAKVQAVDPDMEIRSGEIFSVTDNVQCFPYGATLSASNAQVRVTDFRKVSATHRLWGLRLRWLNSSTPTCYQIQYDGTQWIVNAFVAGTGTQVGAAYPDAIAVGIAHATFGARVTTPDPAGAPNTHLIEILINGSVVHSVTHTGADPALAGAVGSRRVGVTTKGASTTGYTCTAIEAWVP